MQVCQIKALQGMLASKTSLHLASRTAQAASASSLLIFPVGKPHPSTERQPLTKRHFSMDGSSIIAPIVGIVCLYALKRQ